MGGVLVTFSQRALLLYPAASLSAAMQDAVAQAYVTHLGLESFADERAMFAKAAAVSSDYGATETHRQISSAMTPALAAALKAALSGMTGVWYLLDAASGALLDTNDAAKKPGATVTKPLDWRPGIAYAAGEVARHNGQLYAVVQAHTSQADWPPEVAVALFKRYLPPGEATPWVQPGGSHDAYPVGARVTYNGQTWVNTIAANVWQPGVTGWQLDGGAPATSEWVSGEQGLKVGDVRTYSGIAYRVVQNPGVNIWPPPTAPALWQPV